MRTLRPRRRAAARGLWAPWYLLLVARLLLHLLQPGFSAPCISSGLPKPINVTFSSVNMKNVLQWNSPEGLRGTDVVYTVQYLIYGQKRWLNKSECRNINRTSCDLSYETYDHEEQYYGRVKVIWGKHCSKWAETERFNPWLETQIGPPVVALTPGEKSISVVLTAPEKWKRNAENNSVSMHQIYPTLKYNVSIHNTKANKKWYKFVTNHTLEFPQLESDTLYCISVQAYVQGPLRKAKASDNQCITTLKDQTSELKVKIILCYILPISVTAFIFSIIGCSMYRYIHIGKEKQPTNLVLIYRTGYDQRLFAPAEKVVVNFITFSIVEDAKTSSKDLSLMERVNDISDVSTAENMEGKSHQEEPEVKHLGYASKAMDIFCDNKCLSPVQPGLLCSSRTKNEPVIEYEFDVRPSDTGTDDQDQEINLQEGISFQGKLMLESETTLANFDQEALLCSYNPQLRNLQQGTREDTETKKKQEEEEESRTLVDWDPQTGRLCIPSLSDCGHVVDEEGGAHSEYDGYPNEGLLSKLCDAQAPNKSPPGNETYLVQFMEEWGLHIQMED
ncbi:interleukin-20 receptor subunit alpha isoform X1 [Phascolarctos cinereus]|uniref:Interleukin-20 receptor subunit alpha isoform X1 n=2 Tax=Phascolarctos cinereus TaxID=38626 RepID=A0A6P5KBG2_PHACI|nr:interleukin-20 receptor subunit alpha isoform X1 [Phascolarctos cinereus]